MARLRSRAGLSARALEFTILTAARSGEALGARWDEINLAERIWIVPPERMKAAKEHRVPLSDAAVAVLQAVLPIASTRDGKPDPTAPVFPGIRHAIPLSRMVMVTLLHRMGRHDSVHGFRSTFRDWAAERTAFPSEVAEMALAHAVGDKVEAAYRRGDMFVKRQALMDAWGQFCTTPATVGEVVPLHAAR
jgi:integrase